MSQHCSPYQFCTWFHIRFQSNEPGRRQSRFSHFSSRENFKWLLIKSNTITMFMAQIFFFHESVAKQNVNWLISRKLKSRDAKSSHKFTWFSVCARLIVRSPHMNAAKSWEKSFIVLSKVKFQLINCCVMASKFIQFTFIGQWLRTLIFNSNDNDEKETKSKYFRFVSVFD